MDNQTLKTEIQDAIGAHGAWKHRLRSAASKGDTTLNVSDITRNDLCKFGQWLNTIPNSPEHKDHLQETKALHTQFHRAAGDVARMIVTGQGQQALSALETGAFADTSRALAKQLTDWKRTL